MNTQTAALGNAARLLIHSGKERGAADTFIKSALSRLGSLCMLVSQRRDKTRLGVQVSDLAGHQIFASESVNCLIELPLPAGTYRVVAYHGKVQRTYTMKLEPQASVDLYLRP